jgi:hypothetical protein
VKKERLTFGKIRFNLVFVDISLFHVGHANHDDVGLLDSLRDLHNLKAMSLGDSDRLTALVQTDDDIASTILEVQGMSMAL